MTNLCEPSDDQFQEWLDSIPIISRTGELCIYPIVYQNIVLLFPEETKNFKVDIPDDQNYAEFITYWSGSTIDTIVIDPNGRVIDPGEADIDADIYHFKGETFETYEITNPIGGEWEIQIFGSDVPIDGEQVNLLVKSLFIDENYLPMIVK